MDDRNFYEVRGFAVRRYSYFDPRVRGYKLFAGSLDAVTKSAKGAQDDSDDTDEEGPASASGKKKGKGAQSAAKPTPTEEDLTLEPVAAPVGRWSVDIPLTGEAIALTKDAVFVAGLPAYFPPDHSAQAYEEAFEGERGGMLWAASASDGKKLAEVKLDAPPVWDSLAAADGRLYLATKDGRLTCLGSAQ